MISYMNITSIFTDRKDCAGRSGSNVRGVELSTEKWWQLTTDTSSVLYTGVLFKATTLVQYS